MNPNNIVTEEQFAIISYDPRYIIDKPSPTRAVITYNGRKYVQISTTYTLPLPTGSLNRERREFYLERTSLLLDDAGFPNELIRMIAHQSKEVVKGLSSVSNKFRNIFKDEVLEAIRHNDYKTIVTCYRHGFDFLKPIEEGQVPLQLVLSRWVTNRCLATGVLLALIYNKQEELQKQGQFDLYQKIMKKLDKPISEAAKKESDEFLQVALKKAWYPFSRDEFQLLQKSKIVQDLEYSRKRKHWWNSYAFEEVLCEMYEETPLVYLSDRDRRQHVVNREKTSEFQILLKHLGFIRKTLPLRADNPVNRYGLFPIEYHMKKISVETENIFREMKGLLED